MQRSVNLADPVSAVESPASKVLRRRFSLSTRLSRTLLGHSTSGHSQQQQHVKVPGIINSRVTAVPVPAHRVHDAIGHRNLVTVAGERAEASTGVQFLDTTRFRLAQGNPSAPIVYPSQQSPSLGSQSPSQSPSRSSRPPDPALQQAANATSLATPARPLPYTRGVEPVKKAQGTPTSSIMAFFSKKKHHKDQQAASAAGASGGGIAGAGPSQSSSGGGVNGAGMPNSSQQQQQPAMYVSSSRGEGPTGMAGPGNPYNNAPPFDGNMQQSSRQQQQYGNHPQQQQGYPQYMQQQAPPQQQSGYPGPAPLSNGMVSGAYGQQGPNDSPQQSTYPNGIGINVPSAGPNAAMGPGGLPGRNFSANSGNSLSNGTASNAVGPPLQPLPAPGPQAQAPSSSQHTGSHGQSSSGSHSSPVSYPWSQRPIRLQPIQLARPSASDAQAPLSDEISPSPFPRYGHSVNPIAQSATGDLYLFGGLVKDEVSNDLFMISCSNPNPTSAQSNESKALAGAPINVSLIETRGERPCARVGHASVSVGNVLIIWGGDTKTKEEDPQDNNLYLLNLGKFCMRLSYSPRVASAGGRSLLTLYMGQAHASGRWSK